MLRSIKQLYGDRLGAVDGEIGQIIDFYFDEQTWSIRYVAVDTGSWLPGRRVLISPHALGRLDQAENVQRANLTRNQIENSPSIKSHKPVSREFESEYCQYFGWPHYWQNDADNHLRRTQAVVGYHLQATDGIVGYVCDFMMDAANWTIGQLVVKTGHRFSGKEVLISTSNVARISYAESTVFANLSKDSIDRGITHELAPVPAAV
jgi:hypothetical protein